MSKISDLIFDDKNFNKGTASGKELMQKSINKFGAGRSILIDKNNRIIAGNKTTENFSEAGYDNVQIVDVTGDTLVAVRRNDIDLDTPEGREFALADNQTAKVNIDFDYGQLEAELDESVLEDWGIENPEEDLEAEEDDFDTTPPEIPITVLGDLYEIGEHRLLCGDSTCSDTVAKLMNGEKSELLFTSPPYSDMREYNGDKDLSVSNISDFIPTFLPFAEYQAVNLGMQIKEREVYPYWDEFIQKGKDCGYKLMAWNVWHKTAVNIGQQKQFFPCYHEWIFVFGKDAKDLNKTVLKKTESTKKIKKTGRRQSDGSIKKSSKGDQSSDFKMTESVFKSNPELGLIRGSHPATFPIELPTEYITAMTNEGDIVTEPFTGSGSTMVASHQLKRKCYGLELDPKYVDVIVKRMLKLDHSLTLKRNGVQIDHKEFTEA